MNRCQTDSRSRLPVNTAGRYLDALLAETEEMMRLAGMEAWGEWERAAERRERICRRLQRCLPMDRIGESERRTIRRIELLDRRMLESFEARRLTVRKALARARRSKEMLAGYRRAHNTGGRKRLRIRC